jgi:hypothetical protein
LRDARDHSMHLPWKHVKLCAQFLKALYPGSVRKLGEWSITVNNKNKLVYPQKYPERIQLAKDFIAMHNSFAAGTSPLQIFISENEIDFVKDLAAVLSVADLHEQFASAMRDKESEREERDVLWKPVMKNVRAVGSYLKTLFSGHVHKAGEYGFTVDSSRRKPQLRRSMVAGGQTIIIKGAAIGSVFTNHGTGELHLIKPKRRSIKPIIIPAGQKMEVPKGYSNLVVFNPSNGENGVFSSFFHR